MAKLKRRIYRISDVCDLTGWSRATVYRLAREGHLPPLRQFATRCTGFLAEEIDDLLTNAPLAAVAVNDGEEGGDLS